VDIPLDRLTVVTGVAGAGKSSLVFDTLYAEARRRLLRNFPLDAGHVIERTWQPDAAFMGPMPTAIAIHGGSAPQRATVGELTGVGVRLRHLFQRAGTLVCPTCGGPVATHRAADVIAALEAMPAGTRCSVAFPAIAPATPEQAAWLKGLLEEGYF